MTTRSFGPSACLGPVFLVRTYSRQLPVWKERREKTIAKSARFYQNLRFGRRFTRFRRAFVRFDDRGQARDPLVVVLEAHDDDALRRAARALDVVDGHPNHRPSRRDQHHLIAVANDLRAGELPLRLGQLHRPHPETAPALPRVVAELRPLAVAVLRHDEDVALVDTDDVGRDHLVALPEAHTLDTAGVATHRTSILLAETNGLPLARHHQEVVVTRGAADGDELVTVPHLDRDDAVRLQRRVVSLQLRFLDDAVLRREDEVLRLGEVARLNDGTHLLALAERKQVLDRPPLRLTRSE